MSVEETQKHIEQHLRALEQKYKELTELEHENLYLYNDFTRLKNKITKEVLEEVNEQGKPKYPNDKAREAEIGNRMSNDAEFQEVYLNYKTNMLQINKLKREVDVERYWIKYLITKLVFEGERKADIRELEEEVESVI